MLIMGGGACELEFQKLALPSAQLMVTYYIKNVSYSPCKLLPARRCVVELCVESNIIKWRKNHKERCVMIQGFKKTSKAALRQYHVGIVSRRRFARSMQGK